jgi:hypothetical protein
MKEIFIMRLDDSRKERLKETIKKGGFKREP